MNKYTLPTSVEIDGVECKFNSDFRDILEIFKILNEPNLLDPEKVTIALDLFYKDENYKINVVKAINLMFEFISQEDDSDDKKPITSSKPLYDWDQDFNLIIAPINRTLGYDIRGKEYVHWWTFMSAFMEIGECTFSTYVGIRDKLNKGKKLEKYEQRLLKEHGDSIRLKTKVDDTTQDLMNEILGV